MTGLIAQRNELLNIWHFLLKSISTTLTGPSSHDLYQGVRAANYLSQIILQRVAYGDIKRSDLLSPSVGGSLS
jgi:hypothetical protein